MRRSKSVLFYALLSVALAVSLGVDYAQGKEMEEDLMNTEGAPPAIGALAPDFQIVDERGGLIDSADFEGRPYALVFWKADCSPSLEMLSALEDRCSLAQEHGIKIVAVHMGQDRDEAEKALLEKGLSATLFTDRQKSAKWAFKIKLFPTVYIVDSDGIIAYRQSGYGDEILANIVEKMMSIW